MSVSEANIILGCRVFFNYSDLTKHGKCTSVLQEMDETASENDKIKIIQDFLTLYANGLKEHEYNDATYLILHLFTRFSNKKVVKKYLIHQIAKLKLTESIIKTASTHINQGIQQKNYNIKQCIDLMNFISIMEVSYYRHEEIIPFLFPVCYQIFQGFVNSVTYDCQDLASEKDNLATLVNATLKQIITVFVKITPYLEIISKEYSMGLVMLAYKTIINKNICFEMKVKSGLIFIHSLSVIPKQYCVDWVYQECPPLELLSHFLEKSHFTVFGSTIEFSENDETLVVLYASILSVLPLEQMIDISINGKKLIVLLFEGLLACAENHTNNPTLILEISRSLSILGKHLRRVPIGMIDPLLAGGMSYVLSHNEHFMDSVRNYVKLFFSELVLVVSEHRNSGYTTLESYLMESIKKTESSSTLRLMAYEKIGTHIGSSFLIEHFPVLPEELLHLMLKPTICEQVAKTYMVVMDKHYHSEEIKEKWINIWLIPVTKMLKSYTAGSHLYQRIFLKSFELYPPIIYMIYSDDNRESSQECGVFLKCMRHARNSGIQFSGNIKCSSSDWRGMIDKTKMEILMMHQEDDIRISALAAIVESQKSTELFSNWELDYLLNFLRYNIACEDPNIRFQIQSFYKKALFRFNAGLRVIEKRISTPFKNISESNEKCQHPNEQTMYNEIHMYKRFIRRFTEQLVGNLSFDSNFSRRLVSLDLLTNIQSFMNLEDWLSCWTEDDVKNCHNILFDGYECNKRMALTLLKSLPHSFIGFTSIELTSKYLEHCIDLALDVKPSKSLSAPYLLHVCTLSTHFPQITLKEKNELLLRYENDPTLDILALLTSKLAAQIIVINDSCHSRVYHGLIFSIRHLLENRNISNHNEAYSTLFQHVIKKCLHLVEYVLPAVCDASPEGYLPDVDEFIPETDESSKAQMFMVNAWRSLKEIAHLFGEIIRQTIKLESHIEMINEKLILEIGNFFIKVFIESKHRGVFEQAFNAFLIICESLSLSKHPHFNSLPQIWLEGALAFYTGKNQSDKLCPTRRSAGLPYLLLSTLGTEPNIVKSRFHGVFITLSKVCENFDSNNRDNRIHSLNTLKNMFRDSKLGEIVAPYIDKAVIIAIESSTNKDWGIRNSATLLFSALITRMFGVQRTAKSEDVCLKNRLTVRVFLLRFPLLVEFLLEKMRLESQKSNSTMLHPMLLILSRLYPSSFEDFNSQMDRFIPHLERCLSNQHLKTRELAAQALVAFLHHDQIQLFCETAVHKICCSISNNEIHGHLLGVWYILKSKHVMIVPVHEYFYKSMRIMEIDGNKYSHLTMSLYMEILMLLLEKCKSYNDKDMLRNIVSLLSRQITFNVDAITSRRNLCQNKMILLLYVLVNKLNEGVSTTYSTITHHIMSQLYGCNRDMKFFFLNLLIYMHQTQNKKVHPLFQLKEIEICQQITDLVDSFEEIRTRTILIHSHQYLKYFLSEELNCQQNFEEPERKRETLLFLLLFYYPCVLKHLNTNQQQTLDMLLRACRSHNEDLISAVISCISQFLKSEPNVLNYEELVEILVESASPAASECRRLAVCELLTDNFNLYGDSDSLLAGGELEKVLNIVMVLLEDDSLMVRKAMSNFASIPAVRKFLSDKSNSEFSQYGYPVIPESARESLLKLVTIVQNKNRAICFIFSWACRHFPDQLCDSSEVFERGELNLYAENISFVDHSGKLLIQLLWNVSDELEFDAKLNYIQENSLSVTKLLLEALVNYPSPMMLNRSKMLLIETLKLIIFFLETLHVTDNFENCFRIFFYETVMNNLKVKMELCEFLNVKRIMQYIYEPILKEKRIIS